MGKAKKDIALELTKNLGVDIESADRCVENILNTVMEWISQGEKIEIRGFGTLYPKAYKERKGRVVKHNREIVVPACVKPKFKASPTFVEMCNKK
jgi:nucleoid DNA-binding protein